MPPFSYPQTMRRLINELSKLPSIGERSAIRLAYHLLTAPEHQSTELARVIGEARAKTRLCQHCYCLTEEAVCGVCADGTRDRGIICVVEKPADVFVLERSGGYRGLYHVLHGLWSPLRGVAPEHTKMPALMARIERSMTDPELPDVRELILATGATVEGDATAMYIAKASAHFPVVISRIAQGLPKGGELEFADELTLSHALEGRRRLADKPL